LSNVNANINTINSNINGLNNNVANLQKDALQWNGTAYDASHGTANAQRITNVAAGQIGENSTDAINAGQLFSVSTSTAASLSTLSSTLNQAGDLSNVNANINTINSNINGLNNNVANLQKDALQWNGTAYDASHGTANAQRITNVAAGQIGENSTDAINAGQLFSVSTSTAASLSTLSSTLNQAGDLSNVNANISTINSNINGLNNNVANLQKDALQWNGSAYDASHGTANAQRITNVAVGDTGEYSTDAVNGGQLYSLSSSTMSSVNNLSTTFSDNLSTGLSTANSRIDTVAQSTTTLAGNLTTAINSISTLQKDALQWNGTAYDASHGTANAQRITNVAAGQIGENSTDAINAGQLFSVSTSTAASLSTLSSTLNQAGDLSNVNANITTINSNLNGLNNNVANLQKDALQWNGTAYDASHGTANAQRITNVAVGDTGEYSTDAVNGGQLYSLSSSTVSGLNNLSTTFSDNLSTGLSTANSRIDTVAQSTTTLAGNLTTAVNSISTLQKDALQWNGTAYDASHGTANAQRITNVANGTIGENSTDAVNGGQLYSLSSSIMSSVSSTVDNVVNQNKINIDAVNQDIKTAQTALKIAQNDIKTAQDDILTSKKLIEALQKNSVHFDDIIDDTTPGFFGLTRDTTERTISNIANGRVDATSNQAVNGRQLWQVKNDFKQELQNLSDSFDTKLAQNNNGSTAAINAATDKANQALAKADSLSTSTAETLSSVAASLGGNASYNTVTNSFTAPSYNSTTADGTAVTANNVGDALTNLYNGGSKYAKVNSTLSVASASGNNAIAVGGAAVASGNGAVAIGAEAKASVADGVAIGNHASVTQSGGIALGANSVANTAGGIMGYIPANATTQQARAIQATTSTEAAVSVGDASKGVYRQITGVAAGTADTDAVNVAQLKGVNARMENINRYINDVNDRVQHVERRAYSGTALAMALSGAYLPQLNAGEQTVGVGMGSYHGYTAVGVNYKATNNNGKFSWGAGVSTTGHETGFNAGIGYKW
ncbi:YadA family autotransporter adhesin, partial [Snodgrassella alvi]|uniref:YadA family autotransporter adhesin n=1 Tax=Snodgrassella alvi TaxID=1196083 RepID=UPI0015D56ECA